MLRGKLVSNKAIIAEGDMKSHSKKLYAKRSFVKGKETIGNIEEREFVQTLKFQSLDGCAVNKNVSGKRIGKEGNVYTHKLHKMF